MKIRIKVKNASELKDGDEFLVGDERWEWSEGWVKAPGGVVTGLSANRLIYANVPIERELEAPEGCEIVDWVVGTKLPRGTQCLELDYSKWFEIRANFCVLENRIYAVPKQPKIYTVERWHPSDACLSIVLRDRDFKPGDQVIVRKVEE
jgi:hypothetical protein